MSASFPGITTSPSPIAARPSAARTGVGLLLEFVAWSILFLLVHALVLRFVFPGFYDPLWPHHSDFYIPPELAHRPDGYLATLDSRPVGYTFFWLIGHLGTRGAIAACLALVVGNAAALVTLLRRGAGLALKPPVMLCATVYFYLLASHPLQYEFSTWDAFSQLSQAFLIAAAACLLGPPRWWLMTVFLLLAFLSKETYAPAAGLLFSAWGLWHRRAAPLARWLPLLLLLFSFALAMAINLTLKSPFISDSGRYGDAYHVVLVPASVLHEWWAYARAGLNLWSVATAVGAALAMLLSAGLYSPVSLAALLLPMAGLLSWLPNACLPHHHFDGYCWNGAALFYAPVLLLAGSLRRSVPAAGQRTSRWLALATLTCALLSPLGFSAAYAREDWTLQNQARQHRLLVALEDLVHQLPPGTRRVLVSGLSFPFSPFDHPDALRVKDLPPQLQFLVLSYEPGAAMGKIDGASQPGLVSRITPDQVLAGLVYDEAWLFRQDGSLIARRRPDSPDWVEEGIHANDALAFPELGLVFGPDHRAQASGMHDAERFLSCGTALLSYHQPMRAEPCLRRALALIPGNPYTHFYLGVALQDQGRRDEARAAFADAVRIDVPETNPAFRNALDQLR